MAICEYEEIYLNEYGSIIELRKALRNYFHFYNTEQPHQTFDGATPLKCTKQRDGVYILISGITVLT